MGRARDQIGSQAADGAARLSLAFPGDPISVRSALKAALGAVRRMGVANETCGVVEIVLAEVLNNVVEHAYSDRHDAVIELALVRDDDGLAFKIRDTGRPMPDGRIPEGLPHDLDVSQQALPEGGFGWHLIRSLTRSLRYRRRAGANELAFIIPLDAGTARH